MLFPSGGESQIVQNVQCFFGHFLLFPPLMKPSHLSFQISSIAGVQCSMGVQARSSSTRWREPVGCQQTSAQGGKEPIVPVWDWGGQNLGLCYGFVIGSSVTTKSSWKLPSISSSLLPKPFALQNYCRVWFTKVLWGLGCEILWQKKAFQLFITSHILNHGKLV